MTTANEQKVSSAAFCYSWERRSSERDERVKSANTRVEKKEQKLADPQLQQRVIAAMVNVSKDFNRRNVLIDKFAAALSANDISVLDLKRDQQNLMNKERS